MPWTKAQTAMAPTLRDALKTELMRHLELQLDVPRAERCVKRKLVDHLFNPETYRNSPDKKAHEEQARQGAKRGGHYLWLVRQVRRLAEPVTPEWYEKLTYTRDKYDTSCVSAYAHKLLEAFPAFEPDFSYDAPEQSEAFRAFDKRMEQIRADLDKYYSKLPKAVRSSKKRENDPRVVLPAQATKLVTRPADSANPSKDALDAVTTRGPIDEQSRGGVAVYRSLAASSHETGADTASDAWGLLLMAANAEEAEV